VEVATPTFTSSTQPGYAADTHGGDSACDDSADHATRGEDEHVKARWKLSAAALGVAAVSMGTTGALATTSVKDYAVPIGGEYEVDALFSVDDQVPLIGDASKTYRMVGIPDGLGAHPNGDGTSTLYMNHELTSANQSQPVVGGAINRGAIVSKWILDAAGNPIAGKRAYDWVYDENTLVGPAPEVGNSTRPVSRFCSGSLAGRAQGLDRPMYFTNEEESTPANTFDGLGGLSVAIFGNELHTLPRLGRFAKENTVVQGTTTNVTVIISLEDGPATLDPAAENSQLYMYVGKQERQPGSSALRRNGLDNGELYVLAPTNPADSSEAAFTSGSINVKWVHIPNAGSLSNAELEAASDAAGAFRFARPEDGAFNVKDRDELFFVTTGDASVAANTLGRLYSLQLTPGDPRGTGTLHVVYNADQILAAGGDVAISPDNIDASARYLMINEDGTGASRPVMASKGRDGSIWRFKVVNKRKPSKPVGVDASTATRVAELDPPGRDGVAVGPGIWETSGIIDASALFGANWWLSDVQAHSPTAAPAAGTVEDGQLFLLRPTS
jgi:hypothetical protein